MGKPLWTFEGFVTDAGNHVVQDWYWHDIDIDDRDAIRDRVSYLENVGRHLWVKPYFQNLEGGIGEIRKNTAKGPLRLYGCFTEKPLHFLALNGQHKKVKNDKQGKDTAKLRLNKLSQGKGGKHGFDFEEEPIGKTETGEGD